MTSLSWISPDPFLELIHIDPGVEKLQLVIQSTRTSAACPSCAQMSSRIHSRYTRKVQDLPINGRAVELLILTRKRFCEQPRCSVKIFTERFEGIASNGRRTKRTEEVLRTIAFSTSCLSAEKVAQAVKIPISHDALLALIYRTEITPQVSPFPRT